MNKIYEGTFGLRFSNASNLATIIADDNNYKAPRDSEKVENFQQLIAAVQQANNAVSIAHQNWSLSVENRKKLFSTNELSLKSMLQIIKAAVRAQYGFKSKEAIDVNAKIKNILGKNGTKKEPQSDTTATDTVKKTVSQSHASFGSVVENFKDLYLSISTFSPAFNPANAAITSDKLKDLYDQINVLNTDLTKNNSIWRAAVLNRKKIYGTLNESVKHIKESVKSQYGKNAIQFITIKNF